MEGIGIRLRLSPGCRRVCEHASSKAGAIRSVAISLQWPVQMPRQQPHATDGQARRKTPTAAERQQYRCDRYRLLPSQQWIPGISQNPVHSFPAATQDVEQHENNCEIAKHKCYFQRKGGLMNRGYCAKEKLSARGIWGR